MGGNYEEVMQELMEYSSHSCSNYRRKGELGRNSEWNNLGMNWIQNIKAITKNETDYRN